MPREQVVETDGKGVISEIFDKAGEMIRGWVRAVRDWLDNCCRNIFTTHRKHSRVVNRLRLDYVAADFALRPGGCHHRRVGDFSSAYLAQPPAVAAAIASEPIQPVPDLADENVRADQLPEDGWTKLARELLERGEFRLAMRAFYLASLAHLAERDLISIARFKSNREYERELHRRAHSFPELLAVFSDNISVFERIWYGTHEASGELVHQFAASVEKMKAAG